MGLTRKLRGRTLSIAPPVIAKYIPFFQGFFFFFFTKVLSRKWRSGLLGSVVYEYTFTAV